MMKVLTAAMRREIIASVLLAQSVAGFVTTSSSQRSQRLPLLWLAGPRIAINENFSGLQQVHTNPDVFTIDNFLDAHACQDLMDCAQEKTLDPSPVAYAGWTQDFRDLVELAAKGPVTWMAILVAWLQTTKNDAGAASQISLVVHMVQNFAVFLALAVVGIVAYTKTRADGLQQLRTSTSTTIDNLQKSHGAKVFVRRAANLLGDATATARNFEAPTVIRYEEGQVLAPHYDANGSAETEDLNRGGQTLATLIVYLNDVEKGGLTRFGKLSATSPEGDESSRQTSLTVKPRRGDALLFFPADASGVFDERTEHEGCPAVDEKWIARIWMHSDRVPPPYGLSDGNLSLV